MMNAYDEMYLKDAMENLGEAFDYAVNGCHMEPEMFVDYFLTSGFADSFGKGNPKFVSGLSGTELVMECVRKAGMPMEFPKAQVEFGCSKAYWCGHILAYYQWITGKSFREIFRNLPISEIYKLYSPLHEASEEKCVDVFNAISENGKGTSKLKERRKLCSLTQKELSDKSGVNLRTLQQYETGAKDLSKASAGSVLALSKVLGCRVEDLLE